MHSEQGSLSQELIRSAELTRLIHARVANRLRDASIRADLTDWRAKQVDVMRDRLACLESDTVVEQPVLNVPDIARELVEMAVDKMSRLRTNPGRHIDRRRIRHCHYCFDRRSRPDTHAEPF